MTVHPRARWVQLSYLAGSDEAKGDRRLGTDRERASRNGRGRGGSLQTTPNPFTRDRKHDGGGRISRSKSASAAIDAALDLGLALIIGRTSDGGAVSLTLLSGEERHRTYCANQDELDEAWEAILGMVEATSKAIRGAPREAEITQIRP